MRYRILLFSLLAVLSGCCCLTPNKRSAIEHSNIYTQEMTKIIIDYSVELEHTRGLNLERSGVCFDESIQKLKLEFLSQNILELCQAREELVAVVDGYLKRINDNVIVRPKLHHYPFNYNDLEVHINYASYFIRYVDPTYTSYTSLEDGTSFFYGGELDTAHTDIWTQRVEPYYKTRQFVIFRKEVEQPYIEAEHLKEKETVLSEERFIN